MIISRQHFDIDDKTVIEKLLIKTPLKQSPVFQDEACFLYFKEGATIISTPTELVEINEGESILLKCGSYFADIINKKTAGISEVYVIHLYPEILKKIYKDEIPHFIKQKATTNYSQKITKNNIIVHFIESLLFYFENPAIVTNELLLLKLKELILLLVQTNSENTLHDLFTHLFTPRQANIAEVIHSHLYSNLTMDQLATLTGQSLSTFKREFQKHFFDAPANYIRNKRMQKAAELLLHSSFTISEICYQVGYEDTSYFSRLFVKTFQHSPSEYRKLNL